MTTDEPTETNSLKDFLGANPPAEKFTPYVREEPGSITVVFKGDPDYSEQLTEEIMLFRSLDTKEIVGCRIERPTKTFAQEITVTATEPKGGAEC